MEPWRKWPHHFSRSITDISGPMVRCMCFPESVNAKDLERIDKFCSNVEEVNFTMTREAIDATRQGTRLELNGHFSFPALLRSCQKLLTGLKQVSVSYGNGMNLQTEGLQSFPEGLPRLLKLTPRLEVLKICCSYRNKRWVDGEGLDEIPQRAETAQELCRAIVENGGLYLNRLIIKDAPFTIANLYDFSLGLETLPHLKTIQVSVHNDLLCYERGYFDRLRDSPDSDPMMEPWDYLNALRRVEERGNFTIRHYDSADEHQCDPLVYFPYSRASDSVDPDFDMAQYASPSYRAIGWTPVWNWLRFFASACPRGPPHPRSWGRYWELIGARQLFQALNQAGAPVSVSFNAGNNGGALFAPSRTRRRERCPKDAVFLFGEDKVRRDQDVSDEGYQPSERSTGELISFGEDSDTDTKTQETPDVSSRMRATANPDFERELARDLAYEQIWQLKSSGQPQSYIPCTEAHLEPKPPFALGQTCDSSNCCDTMTDVRLMYDQTFDECVSIFKDFHPDKLAATDLTDDGLRRACCRHLGKRLEEESKRLAILFRSFKSHFHLLKRLVLCLPAALYPDSDQTFVDHCLPGTGWNVSRPGTTSNIHLQSFLSINPAFKAFSVEQCPFISRVFTRAEITSRAESRITFDVEDSVNVRPLIDLKSFGVPSMETLVTCPLEDHFVYREDFVLHRIKAAWYNDGEKQLMVGGEAWW